MEVSEALSELNQKLLQFDWYAKKTGINPILSNSIVAYVHRINAEVYANVPDKIGDWNVRIHFISSLVSTADDFKVDPKSFTVNKIIGFTPSAISQLTTMEIIQLPKAENPLEDIEPSEEVWKLSKLCGWDTLEDIFYEVYDGEKAVTNRSKEFPKVRETLGKLYETFGFDVLANEIQ
jgi:hypothetical protein